MNHTENIVALREVGIHDVDFVGGKKASLGEMTSTWARWAFRFRTDL